MPTSSDNSISGCCPHSLGIISSSHLPSFWSTWPTSSNDHYFLTDSIRTCVCPCVHFFQKSSNQASLEVNIMFTISGLWGWPSGSLMTYLLTFFTPPISASSRKMDLSSFFRTCPFTPRVNVLLTTTVVPVFYFTFTRGLDVNKRTVTIQFNRL